LIQGNYPHSNRYSKNNPPSLPQLRNSYENKTIIEKFELHSDVDFAVILLSPDDFAYQKGESPEKGKYRARQNVILELGFFLSKLGRKGVFILYREVDNFEFPSDYFGVIYTPYDKMGYWRYKMADEMKNLDPKIDKNRIK
jgi:predicted nucleotide-binding protein